MAASVRFANPADAPAIGAVQSRSWRLAYADLLPHEALAEMTPEALTQPWLQAISEPPSERHRVFVAVNEGVVVGFLALAGIEIGALVIDPFHQRQGHASRLLAAAADTVQQWGLGRIQTWAPEADVALLSLLRSAGITPDGARRTYEDQGREVTELRLAAIIGDDA